MISQYGVKLFHNLSPILDNYTLIGGAYPLT